jgi:hypothetical protein
MVARDVYTVPAVTSAIDEITDREEGCCGRPVTASRSTPRIGYSNRRASVEVMAEVQYIVGAVLGDTQGELSQWN